MYQSNDFFFEVARGARKGFSRVVISGSNADIDAAEDMWSTGGDIPAFSVGGFIAEVLSSDNTNDKAAGTGALTVLVKGVTIAGVYQEETFVMNGTSAVVGLKTWGFINSVEVATAGSTKANTGTITVRVTSAGATWASMPIGYGVSDGAFFYVPSGYRLIIESGSFWSVTAGTIVVGLVVTRGGVSIAKPHAAITNAAVLPELPVMLQFLGGDLVKVRALSVSAANQSAGASFRGTLMDSTAV